MQKRGRVHVPLCLDFFFFFFFLGNVTVRLELRSFSVLQFAVVNHLSAVVSVFTFKVFWLVYLNVKDRRESECS